MDKRTEQVISSVVKIAVRDMVGGDMITNLIERFEPMAAGDLRAEFESFDHIQGLSRADYNEAWGVLKVRYKEATNRARSYIDEFERQIKRDWRALQKSAMKQA